MGRTVAPERGAVLLMVLIALALLAAIAAAMARLSVELRETVALILGEELTQAQAGEVLGVSEGTIAWRMSEVKKRLKAMAAEEAK